MQTWWKTIVAIAVVSCGACALPFSAPPDDPQPPRAPQAPPVPQPKKSDSPAQLPGGDPQPRGLVLVTVDTLRADYLSSYGNAHMLTPNFDRLASGGVLFREAISQATTTSPSHVSLMTGLYLHDHNVYSNFEGLGPGVKTMAQYFSGNDFTTFAIVNMRHLNPEVINLGAGFDVYVRSGNMRRAAATIDTFLSWLDGIGSRRFFAWIHLIDVHTPYHPPAPYDHFYYAEDERDPANRSLARIWPLLPLQMSDHPLFRSWLDGITDLGWVLAQYRGAVSYVDNEVGRLLDALEDRKMLKSTALVVTADHGESLGEHDMYFVHTGLYEPTVHVPLLTYFPGSGRQGREVRDVVELVDVLPTVTDYFNLPAPKGIRGHSLWPLIRGQVQPEGYAFIEHAGRNLVALRSSRYKYIRHLRTIKLQPSYPFVAGKEELYDLRDDPSEHNDLASLRPQVLQTFRHQVDVRQQERLNLRPGIPEIDEQTAAVLHSLGYTR